ncbi:transposase [Kaistia soli]|uniref:transposase n=1 Tax=Kaistia soli TaxID=446684 RepID=UPI00093560C8
MTSRAGASSLSSRPNRAAKSSAPVCRQTYANRNRIECFFNKIKHQHHVATRYDKLASNFLGSVQLATIRIWISSSTRPSGLFLYSDPFCENLSDTFAWCTLLL